MCVYVIMYVCIMCMYVLYMHVALCTYIIIMYVCMSVCPYMGICMYV